MARATDALITDAARLDDRPVFAGGHSSRTVSQLTRGAREPRGAVPVPVRYCLRPSVVVLCPVRFGSDRIGSNVCRMWPTESRRMRASLLSSPPHVHTIENTKL